MFAGATSFDQPSLYCSWKDKTTLTLTTPAANFCTGANCGLDRDCATTPGPTATPTQAPTASGGGGKAAKCFFL
jgi:hypothetical protein